MKRARKREKKDSDEVREKKSEDSEEVRETEREGTSQRHKYTCNF